jgi:microcystin degradation protein MlrC
MRDAGATGMAVEHGPTAVIAIGAIRLVLRSEPGREWDTAIYRSVGLDPAQAGMVFVKSPGHFRVAFGPLAARTLMADTDGPTVGNMARVRWTRVTRPLWPMDR